MAITPEARAGYISALKWAGVPADEGSIIPAGIPRDQDPNPTPWPPVSERVAAAAVRVQDGIPVSGHRPVHDVAVELASLEAFTRLATIAARVGNRELAVRDAAHAVVIVERLARAGSEDAAASLLIQADTLRADGIGEEAFALAKTMLEDAA
jgi:hypothetical protein